MIATVINAVAILLGGGLGLLFNNKIPKRFLVIAMEALWLAVLIIGLSGALKTADVLGMIICLVVGAIIGEALKIEKHLAGLGDKLKKRVVKEGDAKSGNFTEAFLGATLLYCVGSMAIMGGLEAGINNNYTILLSKALLDGISAISYAATLGVGTLFAALPVFVYQGVITLLATTLSPVLTPSVVTEMSAIGGVLLIALTINMLDLREKKIPMGNLLPAVLLPIVYQPLVSWINGLF